MKTSNITTEGRIVAMATYRHSMRVRTMCRQLKMDESTLVKKLRKMERDGLITVEQYGRGRTLMMEPTKSAKALLN